MTISRIKMRLCDRRNRPFRTAVAVIAAALAAVSVQAAPLDSGADRAALIGVLTELSRATTLQDAVAKSDLARQLAGVAVPSRRDLLQPGTVPAATGPAAFAEVSDLRVALTQLAIQAGTNDHLTLVRAQTDAADPKAIFLRGGVADLASLAELVTQVAPEAIIPVEGGFRLLRPLVVWTDAALQLKSGDVLELDPGNGSFVLSFGRLDVTDATVRSAKGVNAAQPTFRPFLLSLGDATFSASQSRFEGLGFGRGTLFGGVAVANRGLFRPAFSPAIVQSVFVDTQALHLDGTIDALVVGNRFGGIAAGGLVVAGGSGAVITGNVFSASLSGSALRITHGARDATVTDNILTDSRDTAILIDGQASRITVAGNLIDRTTGSGLVLRQTTCTTIRDNLISRGAGTGMRLTDSGPALIASNAIVLNGAAGAQLEGHVAGAVTEIAGNVFSANRFGLSGAGLGRIDLRDNAFSGQLPRLFDGEFGTYLAAFLDFQATGNGQAAFEIIPPVFLKDTITTASATNDATGVDQHSICGE
jgi:hypothetical protein